MTSTTSTTSTHPIPAQDRLGSVGRDELMLLLQALDRKKAGHKWRLNNPRDMDVDVLPALWTDGDRVPLDMAVAAMQRLRAWSIVIDKPAEMPSTEKARGIWAQDAPVFGWIQLEPAVLAIRTPPDLARLLKTAMDTAGLRPGQVATKTGIHRSQVYLLTKPEKGSLPRNPDQLRTFMAACRMHPDDVDLVLARWELLDDLRRQRLTPELVEHEPSDVVVLPDHAVSGQEAAALAIEPAGSADTAAPTTPGRVPRVRRSRALAIGMGVGVGVAAGCAAIVLAIVAVLMVAGVNVPQLAQQFESTNLWSMFVVFGALAMARMAMSIVIRASRAE